ncbi:o-succinylbenzoate synthase [Pontibacter vulgaris]|uniref:o-succinylbenzoate synthase n=1 Tax=Pontibacter vulgaris TaxID=2905679 RepID=UPI001FA70E09|nr:o-succinylbenzoate synthase [Pontibacter vulgaris]
MKLKLNYVPHTLHFKFDARTSRGSISEHKVFYLQLCKENEPEITGVGECAPLAGLSVDYRPDLEAKLRDVCRQVSSYNIDWLENPLEVWKEELALTDWPAILFALETAILDLKSGGAKQLFDNGFSRGEAGIPINGLIWMGEPDFMQDQIRKKLAEGYNCLKLKIGGLDFASELEILQSVREAAGPDELTIRVDANGAFKSEEAFRKLERLAHYGIHSIEQPIRQGQVQEMAQLCNFSPIPIALDEELIGVLGTTAKTDILEKIMPHYIILKPTLVGGMAASAEWIKLAEERNIGWWMTSALESNIGLNAISQFTSNYTITMPQGLGTGQLYHNNIPSPLLIEKGKLWYSKQMDWGSIN